MKLILLALGLWTFATQASVVTVESTYPDQAQITRTIKVRGSGLLFAYNSKFYVFTASHVSQGENLNIQLDSKTLTIVKRRLHDSQDLELIEVSGVTAQEVRCKFDGFQWLFDASGVTRKRAIDSYNFIPLLPWITDPNVDADNSFAATRGPTLITDILQGTLHGPALVQPGMSGAPLVTVVPDKANWSYPTLPYDVREGLKDATAGQVLVRGIAIRRDRFFAHAAFINRPWMLDLLRKYLANEESKAEFKWKARGAVLFREMEGYQETSSYAASGAGGLTIDSGNGVTMDGGDLDSLGEDSPKEFLKDVSAFPVIGGTPLMYWPLMMRHPKTGQMISMLTWFDMEFYPRLNRFIFMTGPVKEDDALELVGQIGTRLGKRTPYEITSPENLKVDAAGLTARLRSGDDVVEFRLNRAGAQCVNDTCEARFQPVIETVSAQGLPYIVDLRQFFFVDLGARGVPDLMKPGAENLSSDEAMYKAYDELALEYGRPRISFRRKRTMVEKPMLVSEGQVQTVEWQWTAPARNP